MWRGIVWARKSLKLGACFKLGDSFSINAWTDPWVPSLIGFMPSPKEGLNISLYRRVGSFKVHSSNEWNAQLVKEIFIEESANEILKLQWPPFTCEDILIWMGNSLGHFSVKDCYNLNFCGGNSLLISDN